MSKASGAFLVVLTVLFSTSAFAGQIPVINLSLSADLPSNGIQELALTNETGSGRGCNSAYVVCDALEITNWTLTITYSSSFYNNSGPALATPFVLHWQGSNDNLVSTADTLLDFDLCNGADVSSCTTPTTTISRIDFTGTLDQSSFAIFDPAANGGAGGAGPTFFSDGVVTATFIVPSGFPRSYAEQQDGYVSDQAQNAVTPEPATGLLLLGGFAVAAGLRARTQRKK